MKHTQTLAAKILYIYNYNLSKTGRFKKENNANFESNTRNRKRCLQIHTPIQYSNDPAFIQIRGLLTNKIDFVFWNNYPYRYFE